MHVHVRRVSALFPALSRLLCIVWAGRDAADCARSPPQRVALALAMRVSTHEVVVARGCRQ
jgi:hypothetical protein